MIKEYLSEKKTAVSGSLRDWFKKNSRKLIVAGVVILAIVVLSVVSTILSSLPNDDEGASTVVEKPTYVCQGTKKVKAADDYELVAESDTYKMYYYEPSFSIRLELWRGEELLDTQRILSASGYTKELGMRRSSLAFLMELDHKENILHYSLMHGGASSNRVEYQLPDIKIQGWGRDVISRPVNVDRETGTILACMSLDTGSGVRTITTGNIEKPNLNEGAYAVVLRLVVESQ